MLALTRFAFLVLAAISMLAPRAFAAAETPPTPAQVVERYVAAVQDLVARNGEALHRFTELAVTAIGRMDSNGAPDEAILRAGHRAQERVRAMTTRSLNHLRKLTEGALRILNRLDAADEFKMAVRMAADEAAERIRAHGRAASAAIAEAVDAATADPGAEG